MCQSSDELIGQSVNFLVRVPRVSGLNPRFANDVYVRWTFMDMPFETFAVEGKSLSPCWEGYEHRLCLENIDDRT